MTERVVARSLADAVGTTAGVEMYSGNASGGRDGR